MAALNMSHAQQRGPIQVLPRWLAAALLLGGLNACAHWLPSSSDSTRVPWSGFDEARAALERVEPARSRREELFAAGFDPYTNPSATILSWPDLLQRFASAHAINGDALDHGLLQCLRAGHRCSGLLITVRKTRRDRVGNFWSDSLAFHRESVLTGWTFNALIVFVDDIVVYRAFGGQPKIEEISISRNPLGPLQAWGESVGAGLAR